MEAITLGWGVLLLPVPTTIPFGVFDAATDHWPRSGVSALAPALGPALVFLFADVTEWVARRLD